MFFFYSLNAKYYRAMRKIWRPNISIDENDDDGSNNNNNNNTKKSKNFFG